MTYEQNSFGHKIQFWCNHTGICQYQIVHTLQSFHTGRNNKDSLQNQGEGKKERERKRGIEIRERQIREGETDKYEKKRDK